MKIALILGSFNPIHYGHIHLGDKILDGTDIDEVWFTVSPQNPFKVDSSLEDENHRLKMVDLSLTNDKFKSCDIELSMDKPSYTYKTLRKLSELYPNDEFHLVMGSDVINSMSKWSNFEEVGKYPLITFVRNDEKIDTSECISKSITILKSDIVLSSTEVRSKINNNESLEGLVPKRVAKYIKDNNLFKN